MGKKPPEIPRVPRLAETLFSEIDPLKMSREIEPQMAESKPLRSVLKFLKIISRDSRF